MTARRLHPNLTPGRRAWLEKLRDGGPARRSRGPVGFECMRLGWTQWVFQRGTDHCTEARILAEYGSWSGAFAAGWELAQLEALTAAGRAKLEAGA